MLGQKQIKVLSLNIYIMGHITYQDTLEKTFGDYYKEINFFSLHLADYFKTDFLGRVVYWLLSKRLPGAGNIDYDFNRFRTELANSFFAHRCLGRTIKNYQPHVLHIHTQGIAFLVAPLLRQFPSVISLDVTAALLAIKHPFPSAITYKPILAFEQKCFDSAGHIITWSNWAKQSVIDDYGIVPQKVTTIYPPVASELFEIPVRNQSSRLDKTRLLFVGNDFVRKGGEDLLAVFLEELYEICELDIVTNTPLNLPNLPNLRIHQGVRPLSDELRRLYQMADIFVMPTHEEVYGLVFGEAMAAGLPCIGTNIMAVPELVQNGRNGFTIVPGDRQALYQAIRQLIDNPALRFSMGLVSRELAKQKFDAVSNCKQTLQIFHDLLLQARGYT